MATSAQSRELGQLDELVSKAKRAAQEIRLLKHAEMCRESELCGVSSCGPAKVLLQHIRGCNNPNCKPSCLQSKRLLQHFSSCGAVKNPRRQLCLVCGIVKNGLSAATSPSASVSANADPFSKRKLETEEPLQRDKDGFMKPRSRSLSWGGGKCMVIHERKLRIDSIAEEPPEPCEEEPAKGSGKGGPSGVTSGCEPQSMPERISRVAQEAH